MARRDSPFRLRPRLVAAAVARALRRGLAARALGRGDRRAARAGRASAWRLHEALARAGLPTVVRPPRDPERLRVRARVRRGAGAQRPARASSAPPRRAALEPALAPGIAGAILHPRRGALRPGRRSSARCSTARARTGAEVRTGVETLRPAARRTGASSGSTRRRPARCAPGTVVLAAGAWTRALAARRRRPRPARGGQGLPRRDRRRPRSGRGIPIYMEEARVIATPLAGRLRLAGTLELVGPRPARRPGPARGPRPRGAAARWRCRRGARTGPRLARAAAVRARRAADHRPGRRRRQPRPGHRPRDARHHAGPGDRRDRRRPRHRRRARRDIERSRRPLPARTPAMTDHVRTGGRS